MLNDLVAVLGIICLAVSDAGSYDVAFASMVMPTAAKF